MKKILVIAAMLIASTATFAQNAVGQITIQPKIGLNLANLTGDADGDIRCGLAAGAEFEYGVTDMIGLSAGVLYSMQGCKTDHSTTKLDYINIPILCNVYVAKGLAVKLGIQPGFNVNSKVKGEAFGYSKETDIDVESFDFSIPVGISYQFESVPVVLDARYNWGLTKVWESVDKNPKNSVFQFTVGYKFSL